MVFARLPARCAKLAAAFRSRGLVERGGFEPPKAKPTDLQSAPFDRFGTSPAETSWAAPSRSTVFEVKFKSEETLPSRSLLPAIVKAAVALTVRPSRFRKPRPASTAVRSLMVAIRTR
jgi:hypothetical protein